MADIRMFERSQGVNFSHSSLTVLQSMQACPAASALSAFHNSDELDPPKCHPNTRVAILNKIKDWILGKIDTEALVLWLYGAAGAGKSAIARSIAEWCEEQGILVGNFFFSRSDLSRNSMKPLIATIAYCLARTVPEARDLIGAVVEADPNIFRLSLSVQIARLISEPLIHLCSISARPPPHVIVIDGLDECSSMGEQRYILDVLTTTLRSLPCKILLASRPESSISTSFNNLPLREISTRIALSNSLSSEVDIHRFLVDKFAEIRRSLSVPPPTPDWPTGHVIRQLVRKSSGQFILASIVIKYVSSPRHQVQAVARLNSILGIYVPIYGRDLPFTQLDALYAHIFNSTEDPALAARVVAVCILDEWEYQTSVDRLAAILEIDSDYARSILADLASILEVQGFAASDKVHIFHASLGDFLFDPSRSGDLWIDQGEVYTYFACEKMKMKGKLKGLSHDLSRAKLTRKLLASLSSFNLLKMLGTTNTLPQLGLFFTSLKACGLENSESYWQHLLASDNWLVAQLKTYVRTTPELSGAIAMLLTLIYFWKAKYGCTSSDPYIVGCLVAPEDHKYYTHNQKTSDNLHQAVYRIISLLGCYDSSFEDIASFVVTELVSTRAFVTDGPRNASAAQVLFKNMHRLSYRNEVLWTVFSLIPSLLECASSSSELISTLMLNVTFPTPDNIQVEEYAHALDDAKHAINGYLARVRHPRGRPARY